MVSVAELKVWLATLPEDSFVAIDDGGLALWELTDAGEPTTAYYEVGGMPEVPAAE